MPNVAMLYHGNNEALHPAHRGFAESINADILSISDSSPHSFDSIRQEFENGYSIGEYDTVIAEGSRPLYTGLIHKMIYGSNLVYLCADHRLYELWEHSVEVESAYTFFKHLLGTYGKPAMSAVARRGIDGIIAVSEFVKERMRPIVGDSVAIRVAHPYIQPDLYEILGRLQPTLDGKVALTVGRATHYKGVDLLVDAWPAVRRQHPEAELHVVGKNHPESFAEVPGVTVHGFVDDLASMYANASLYVQPSRTDPFPVTVLEALRTGLPALVTEKTGSRSEVKKIDERFVSPLSSDELSTHVSWYFSLSHVEKEEVARRAKELGKRFDPESRKQIFRSEFEKLQDDIVNYGR